MSKSITPIANPTEADIQKWLETYGDIYQIIVAVEPTKFDPNILSDDDVEAVDHIVGYICPPDQKVLSFAIQMLAKPIDAGERILKNCWLGGDERICNDRNYVVTAATSCLELIELRQGKLKKLSATGRK